MTNEALTEFIAQNGEQATEALTFVEAHKAYEVTDKTSSDYMSEVAAASGARLKAINVELKKIADPQYQAWKATRAFFDNFSAPWKEVNELAKGKVKGFVRAQDVAKKQAELEAQAARQAAVAAQAAQAQAEIAKAAAEAAKEKAEAEGDQQAADEAEADLFGAQGDQAEAAIALAEAQETSRQALVTATTSDEGLGKKGYRRSCWKAEITDFNKLILSVAAEIQKGTANASDLLLPNIPLLNAKAKSLGAEEEFYPGVCSWDDFTTVHK